MNNNFCHTNLILPHHVQICLNDESILYKQFSQFIQNILNVKYISFCHASVLSDQKSNDFIAKNILNRNEYDTWESFSNLKKRKQWLLGRLAAKCAVGQLSSKYAYGLKDISIYNTSHGKPFAVIKNGHQDIDGLVFSISHTHNQAVCLACHDKKIKSVGVDIEMSESDCADFAKYFLHQDEMESLAGCGLQTPNHCMLSYWCLKEATAKAVGVSEVSGPFGIRIRSFDCLTGQAEIGLVTAGPKQLSSRQENGIYGWSMSDDTLLLAITVIRYTGDKLL